MYTFKQFRQAIEEGRNSSINEQSARWITHIDRLRPRAIMSPFAGTRRPGRPGRPDAKIPSILMRKKPKTPNQFELADSILEQIREAARIAYRSLGTIFVELMELHYDAFQAFRLKMFQIFALEIDAQGFPDAADSILDYFFDMDISLTWDADLNTIMYQHADPVIEASLNDYMNQFLGATDGFLEAIIQVLESGDSMYG